MWYEILPSLAGMAVGLWGGWIAVPVCCDSIDSLIG